MIAQEKPLAPIADFIAAQSQPERSRCYSEFDWDYRFRLAGYHSVPLASNKNHYEKFAEAVIWCREQFGNNGFSWTGPRAVFWFDSQENAVLFALRWGRDSHK